jgi:hypothetical protein
LLRINEEIHYPLLVVLKKQKILVNSVPKNIFSDDSFKNLLLEHKNKKVI